jgi:PAS domain S-box-containing protein
VAHVVFVELREGLVGRSGMGGAAASGVSPRTQRPTPKPGTRTRLLVTVSLSWIAMLIATGALAVSGDVHGAALVVALVASTAGVVSGIAAWVTLRRRFTTIDQLQAEADDLAAGLPVETLTGDDEFVRLSQTLRRASERQDEQRRAKEASDARLRAIFDASPDMINIQGPDGVLQMSSPAVRQLLGYEPSDRIGRTSADLMHPDDQPAATETTRRLLSGESSRLTLQYRARHAAGHWVTVESHASALLDDDGQLTGIVAITRDVTPRVELERAQQAARDAADAANRSKSEFLSRMSHELRTPLNAVVGFAQVLELDELADEQRESVGQILKGGRHLLDLINEILDISRIETGQLNLSPEPVWVTDLLRETVELIAPLARQRALTVIPPAPETCDCHVFADRQRLKQIMLNLLSNAVKYNRTGGTIELACTQQPNHRTRISVTDTGHGISKEQQSKLFMPFERLDANQTEVEGTGIGLALARRLAEAMSGSLDATSTVGHGSTFTVELPAAEGPVERYERLSSSQVVGLPQSASPTRPTILYIEDNVSNLKLIERVLARHADVELIAAMQGRIGLDLARLHKPDLVLLDLHLPDVAGDEVLLQLLEDPVTAAIPVVIVSADATPRQVQRLLSGGAAAYVTKPIDVQELLRVVASHLPAE